MAPHIEKLYYRFTAVINNPGIPRSVQENAAIALGRLGCWYSDVIAPHLAESAQSFLRIMRPIDDSDEKTGAIYGFNLTVQKNPRAMEACLLDYFQASTAVRKVDIERHGLEESFQRVSTTWGYDENGFANGGLCKEPDRIQDIDPELRSFHWPTSSR